jgi:hypothetical protein
MIGKYPVESNGTKTDNKDAKKDTSSIISKINEELNSGNTKRYCNYINMGLLNEKYAID